MQTFMEISAVGTELYHAVRRRDGGTDIPKLIVVSGNCVNATKNPVCCLEYVA
jgi:hypothetical protein